MRVGPQSAGSDPGPACYGRGGQLPTVSDAAVVLGYFDPSYFLGGRMRLDVEAARRALKTISDGINTSLERRLKELCEKYGKDTIKAFISNWMEYSEQRMIQAIKKLPKVEHTCKGAHDPLGEILPDGVPLNVTVRVDPDAANIELDLRNNVANVPCGFNESVACTSAAVFSGVFNSIDPSVPRNAGSFRRLRLFLKEGSVCGQPKFPHSCSVATTNVADRLINLTQRAFAEIADGLGLAEGGIGMGAGLSVVSGKDHRSNNEPYINQMFIAEAGGPGSQVADGWPNYGLPVVAGLMYRTPLRSMSSSIRLNFVMSRSSQGRRAQGNFAAPSLSKRPMGQKRSRSMRSGPATAPTIRHEAYAAARTAKGRVTGRLVRMATRRSSPTSSLRPLKKENSCEATRPVAADMAIRSSVTLSAC